MTRLVPTVFPDAKAVPQLSRGLSRELQVKQTINHTGAILRSDPEPSAGMMSPPGKDRPAVAACMNDSALHSVFGTISGSISMTSARVSK